MNKPNVTRAGQKVTRGGFGKPGALSSFLRGVVVVLFGMMACNSSATADEIPGILFYVTGVVFVLIVYCTWYFFKVRSGFKKTEDHK